MDQNFPIRQSPQITPERDRQSQRKRDRLNRLQMTSPTRRNRRHAAHNNQDRPPPPILQPNFMPANEPQAAHVFWPFGWQPPPHFPYHPLPVGQYPDLPRNAIAHVLHAHRPPPVNCPPPVDPPPPVNHDAVLNERTNAAGNNRLRQCNLHRQQERQEIRQQVQEELMAAGQQPPHVPHIPNEPIHPAPPAPPMPPVYGPIHYEGEVGPHNFNNPLHYFAPNPVPPPPALPEHDKHKRHFIESKSSVNCNGKKGQQQLDEMIARHAQDYRRKQQQEAELMNNPLPNFVPHPAPPLHAPPEPDYNQFNIQFQHDFQAEQNERIRHNLLQRQAQEEFHQQQIQLQLQQQFMQQQAQQQQMQQQLWQEEAEQIHRRDQDVQRVGQQEQERQHRQEQRVREQEECLEEALCEYNDLVSQENHNGDEGRRRTQEHQHR
ncbi:hypothetical protein F4604DRAFT_1682554 [Suillus subluteus]|nr:hypothetical protein F4604DRAFT_1682554 [Suillus subluteus]